MQVPGELSTCPQAGLVGCRQQRSRDYYVAPWTGAASWANQCVLTRETGRRWGKWPLALLPALSFVLLFSPFCSFTRAIISYTISIIHVPENNQTASFSPKAILELVYLRQLIFFFFHQFFTIQYSALFLPEDEHLSFSDKVGFPLCPGC